MLEGGLRIDPKEEIQGAANARQHPKEIDLLTQFLTAKRIE